MSKDTCLIRENNLNESRFLTINQGGQKMQNTFLSAKIKGLST